LDPILDGCDAVFVRLAVRTVLPLPLIPATLVLDCRPPFTPQRNRGPDHVALAKTARPPDLFSLPCGPDPDQFDFLSGTIGGRLRRSRTRSAAAAVSVFFFFPAKIWQAAPSSSVALHLSKLLHLVSVFPVSDYNPVPTDRGKRC